MPEIPVLHSERLRLRGWTEGDADALRRIYGDPVTMRYIGDGSPLPPDRAWHALAHLLGRVGPYHPEGWPGVELGGSSTDPGGERVWRQRPPSSPRGGCGRRSEWIN
jgi:RimJ/RimL family protein N-acetyltransferase